MLKYLEDNLTRAEAQKFEVHYSNWYENQGWTLLNIAPCGSLGGHKYVKELTKEEIIAEAHKYNTPKELRKANPYTEKKMWEFGISKECFPNIIHRNVTHRKKTTEVRRYTEQLLKELTSKVERFQDLKSSDPNLYQYLRNHKLIPVYYPDYVPGEHKKRSRKKA